ncbi:MAG: prefoldin subunit alpha [Nitrososphaerales archaeon]
MSEQEKLQSLVAELRMLEAYFNEIDARESLLGRALVESRAALDTIKGFASNEPSDLLVPIGGGLFLKASALPPDKLIINVGAGAMIEKTKEDAMAFLETRIREVEEAITKFESQKADLARRMDSNRTAISDLLEKQRRA